jgi:hypothetical protein
MTFSIIVNNVTIGVSKMLKKFTKWKGEMFLSVFGSPLPEG